MPTRGGFGQPGERITRFASAKEDVVHILYATACAIPTCLLELLGLYAISIILGVGVGYILGFIGIFFIHNPVARWARKSRDEGRIILVITMFVLALLVWGVAGPKILTQAGWPKGLPWSKWWKFWSVVGILVVQGVVAFAAYALIREIVDPSSPSPRNAISRDTPVWPWTRETYDGKLVPSPIPLSVPEPPTTYRRIEAHIIDDNGTEKISRDIPDTGAWWDFLRAIVERGASFSEPEARKWKARGYRRVMLDLMANEKNWIKWRNPSNHLDGIEVTGEGLQVFAGIVKAGRPTA